MATDKMFTIVGTSKLDGEVKLRFANDIMRIKVLAKHGHEDINLIELPEAMTKVEAAEFLKTVEEFEGAAEQAAIADYLDGKVDKPAKAPKAEKTVAPAKAKAPTKAKQPAVKAPKVDLSKMEDAPF